MQSVNAEKRNLTVRYGATQFSYWASSTGATAFATTYLLNKGVASGTVGVLLALSGLLACLTQPLLAAAADRAKRFALTRMLLALSALCVVCFAAQLLPMLPLSISGILYMIGMWSSESMSPLLSALSFACNREGYPINYGAARGVGALASASASLALGFVIAQLGLTWMIYFLLLFRLISIVLLFGYPKLEKQDAAVTEKDTSCSIGSFFSRYRWYCVSLIGILFLGMYHAMTENYLIATLGRLGGDSRHVGTAIFIASMLAAPVITCFAAIRKRIRDTGLLKIAAVSFLLQAVCYYLAKSITAVYFVQLFQLTSYAFLEPAQLHYANDKVCPSDMVKGQAFVTAAYALGCSAGNFAGGQLLALGVSTMLSAGIGMALVGTIVIFLTVNRRDAESSARCWW